MARYKFTVQAEIDLDDSFVEEGVNVGDMIQHEVGNAFNGTGIEESEVLEVEEVEE